MINWLVKEAGLALLKDTYSRTNSLGKYKWDYDVPAVSNKYHGNSIMAAMALVSIKYLEEDNLVRRSLASTYLKILSKNTQIECVKHPNIEKITFSGRHLFQIILPSKINRDEFILKLNELGIFRAFIISLTHFINLISIWLNRYLTLKIYPKEFFRFHCI